MVKGANATRHDRKSTRTHENRGEDGLEEGVEGVGRSRRHERQWPVLDALHPARAYVQSLQFHLSCIGHHEKECSYLRDGGQTKEKTEQLGKSAKDGKNASLLEAC